MSEWIEQTANELPDDSVGLWNIVPAGRRFGLEGDALTDYVRRQIRVLLSRGALPMRGVDGEDGRYWAVQHQYGSRPEEIVENIVQEWLANGAGDDEPWGLMFLLPQEEQAASP